MDNRKIKKNIQEVRTSMNLTQAEMAEKLGISRQAYINLEHGRTALINKQLSKFANVSGVTTEKLILGYNPDEFNAIRLREKSSYENSISEQKQMYENRISELESKLDNMGQIILSLRHNIQSLEEFKDYLLKKLEEE